MELIDPAPRTFFGVPGAPDLASLDAQVAFVGVPYDAGTPQPGIPTGQRLGPAAARAASVEHFVQLEGWYDVETDRDHLVGVSMADAGDVAIQGSDTTGNYERISGAARGIAGRGALMAAVGGDHSISYPLGLGLEALGPFDVVHIDAHADFLDQLGGSRLTGASQLRRLAELAYVGTVSAMGDQPRRARARAGRVVRQTVPEAGALYVSIDLDVLDASVAPGHSLPEPGGLGYRELRARLAEVARRGRVIGFDVVELNPSLDPSGVTARVAAWTIAHLLSEIFDEPR